MLRPIPAHGVLLRLAAECSAAICGVCPGTFVTWPCLRLSMIYCCALRPWSQIYVTCQIELLVPGFGRPVLLCQGKLPRARGMAAYVRDWYGAFRQPTFECGCCEMLVVSCGLRQNFYVYSLYHNPDQDDHIYDRLLTSMATVQAEDVSASFLFVGDLNGHHQEWLGSTTTNSHGVAAFDDCVRLWSVGCRPDPCTWWNTLPPYDWCSWPHSGCCCSTHW